MLFERICRTCLAYGDGDRDKDLQSLYTEYNKSTYIVDMLTHIFGSDGKNDGLFHPRPDDHYPQNICTLCVQKLTHAYNFIKQCEHTFIMLQQQQQYNNNNNNKQQYEYELTTKQCNLFLIHNDKDNDENKEEKQEVLFLTTIKDEQHQQKLVDKDKNGGGDVDRDPLQSMINKQQQRSSKRSKCKICNKSITKLYEHMRLHTKEKPFKCEFCSLEFSIKSNYKRHLRIHKNDRRYQCTICEKRFIVRYALVAHMNVHTRSVRTNTIPRTTPTDDGDDATTGGGDGVQSNSFKCLLCEKIFKGKQQLKAHVCDLHSNNQNTTQQYNNIQQSTITTTTTTHLCNYCGKVFTRKINLEEHLRVHTGERPFQCRYCDKTFRNNTTLMSHEATHTGVRPYTCRDCGQHFRQGAHLRQHKWRHTGIKPYLCTICNKQFTTSGSVTVHMRSAHTGETPYMCHICDKGFYDSGTMNKHKKRFHHLSDGDGEEDIINTLNQNQSTTSLC